MNQSDIQKLETLTAQIHELNVKLAKSEEANATLAARVQALEPVPKIEHPYVPPTDYSQFLSLPKSAFQDLVRAVPDRVCNDLIGDTWPSLRK